MTEPRGSPARELALAEAALPAPTRPGPKAAALRVLRSYGLLLVAAVAFLLMVWLVPTVDQVGPPSTPPAAPAGQGSTQ